MLIARLSSEHLPSLFWALPCADPEALRDALLLSYDCSPELAADLGLGTDPDISQPAGVQDDATPAPAAAAEDGLAEGAGAAAAAVGPAAGGGRRHGTLLRASQTLLHKMSAFQRLEEDVMAQLTSAEDAAGERCPACGVGQRAQSACKWQPGHQG